MEKPHIDKEATLERLRNRYKSVLACCREYGVSSQDLLHGGGRKARPCKPGAGVKVLAFDAGAWQTRSLRPGSIATITCNALGMSAQKCEILAVQRNLGDDDVDISFDLLAAYYEAV